ncbi:MAG: ABC transporter substrate-binding protein [Pseudomonadota bacterium]
MPQRYPIYGTQKPNAGFEPAQGAIMKSTLRSVVRTTMGATAAAVLSVLMAGAALAEKIKVVDLAGRSVEVEKGASRVILGEGRMMYSVALLDRKDPFQRVIGWKDDLIKYDPDAYRKFKAKFPEQTEKVVNFGNPYSGDFSVEKVIAEKADLVILDLGSHFKAQESGVIENLAKVGVPVIFIDFRLNATENTVPSLLLMGRVFDRQDNAQEFIDYYTQQMRKVTLVADQIPADERPTVFIENAAGWDKDACCNTFGPYNFGRLVEQAGGNNWGSQRFSTYRGNVSLEAIIASQPDVIVGTGANWAEDRPEVSAVLLGYDANEANNAKRLSDLAARSGFSDLKAVKDKRFHSIYHQFYNSPYHFVALQALAKWMHPDEFEDVDPQATMAELHEQFLPFDLSGQFWATLK